MIKKNYTMDIQSVLIVILIGVAAGMLSGYKSEMLFPVIFILLSSWLYGKTKVSHFVFAALDSRGDGMAR